MVTRVFLLARRPDLTPEQFSDYWKNVHGPLVAAVPGITGCVQHHAAEEGPYDGVVVLQYPDEDAVAASEASPQWAAVMEDCAEFLDLDRMGGMRVTQHTVV